MLGLDVKSLIINMSEQNFTNLHQLSVAPPKKWYTRTNGTILDTAPRSPASDKIGDAVHVPRVNPRILGEA
jgi:hypothetical protein